MKLLTHKKRDDRGQGSFGTEVQPLCEQFENYIMISWIFSAADSKILGGRVAVHLDVTLLCADKKPLSKEVCPQNCGVPSHDMISSRYC